MTRGEFQPATFINLLAASWIQFMVHDWFVHAKTGFDNAHQVPLTDEDPWFEKPMKVPKSIPDALGPGETGRAAGLRQRELALVGRLADLRHARCPSPPRSAPASTARSSRAPKAACRSIRKGSR